MYTILSEITLYRINCNKNETGQVKKYKTGCIPADWKMANVVPVHKKGSKTEVNNYFSDKYYYENLWKGNPGWISEELVFKQYTYNFTMTLYKNSI